MWVLKRHDYVPPGSFQYTQTEGINHKFEASSDIDALAHIVRDFRAGNNLPRATLEESAFDIITFQCQRLGNMKEYCYDTEGKAYTSPVSVPKAGCGGCGAHV